jgi:trehalose-6-phosphatase
MDLVGFPEEFFSEVVYSETRRALEGIGDDSKVIGWVSSGRHPHAGDPMSSNDLYRILVAAQGAGLKRFLYHPDFDLGAPEWEVISGLCGKRWKEDPEGRYWPSDTPKPDTWNGGRKPKPPR